MDYIKGHTENVLTKGGIRSIHILLYHKGLNPKIIKFKFNKTILYGCVFKILRSVRN